MKEFADDNFKFDENERKLSKRVENTVGKREIARYEQFLLFPQCFQKARFLGASKGVIVWEWVKQRQKAVHPLFVYNISWAKSERKPFWLIIVYINKEHPFFVNNDYLQWLFLHVACCIAQVISLCSPIILTFFVLLSKIF